jgi:hypothetical protein
MRGLAWSLFTFSLQFETSINRKRICFGSLLQTLLFPVTGNSIVVCIFGRNANLNITSFGPTELGGPWRNTATS